MSGHSVKLTYDDFVHFPDDGKRQSIVTNLTGLIWSYLRENKVGVVFGSPLDVVFSHFDVVEPDLLFVSEARRKVLTAKNIQGAPDLVVEVGSPSTRRRDERLKHQLYERFGVSEYWVVDPDLDAIKVYRLTDGRYTRVSELTLRDGDVLTTALLPGLELPLTEIFAEP